MAVQKKYFITALLCLLFAGAADASSGMRCGSKIVNKGDHYSKIQRYCGEPTGVQSRIVYRTGRPRSSSTGIRMNGSSSNSSELRSVRRATEEVLIEEWTYNLGPNKLMRIVKFENGFVTDVQNLGYGYNE